MARQRLKQNNKQKNTANNLVLMAEALKALAHPERIAIIELLCNCDEERMTVKNIYKTLKLDQPIVSRHLGIMKRGGILRRELDGNSTYYFMDKSSPIAESIFRCFNDRKTPIKK